MLCLIVSVLFQRPAVHREWVPSFRLSSAINNVDQALRALKKKLQREGVFREMKLRRNFEKPSEKRARERPKPFAAIVLLRKRMEREGY